MVLLQETIKEKATIQEKFWKVLENSQDSQLKIWQICPFCKFD